MTKTIVSPAAAAAAALAAALPDFLTENADGSMIIDFGDRPATIDGGEVKELTMREPLVSDQMASRQGSANAGEAEIKLIANLCEIAPDSVGGLTMRQYGRCQAALSFLTG